MTRSYLYSGEGGIRTLVPRRANAFRVRPVMTASILLRIGSNANFNNIYFFHVCVNVKKFLIYLPRYVWAYKGRT